jgi:LysR family transcriptional regulator, chromosome initiation inhibitor
MRYLPCAAPGFAARWFPEGPDAAALQRAPVVVFDRRDDLQYAYLRRHVSAVEDVPLHYVPSSADFFRAVALGFGWGMLPELQLDRTAPVTPVDAAGAVDVPLYWQQWRLESDPLDRVAAALIGAARERLGRAATAGASRR